MPTIGRLKLMLAWDRAHSIHADSSANVDYGGGIDGIGVTTGPEKVYLVFYGSQWGTQGVNSQGDVTLSGDPSGEAPYLQEFMKGLGTGSELWSGVMTQYCDGVAYGAQDCPSTNTEHVGYPSGGALAGVWVDESAASPQEASGAQLAQEGVNAAAHFGNTTAASNRDAQYVVLSPTGTDPDGWLTNGFCAWHDYNGDWGVPSSYGDIAFTNFPYVTDVGGSCGQNYVNSGSAGTLDGVSIVEGHEYAETITDQNPAGGWTNFSNGEEVGDLCAWDSGPGAPAQDVTFGTGSFAVQSIWGNDGASGAGTCEISHPIVTNPGNTVTVTNPGSQTGTVGTAVSLQIQASDSASGQTLTYSATGLPAGLSINSSTGLISGTPTTANTYNVTVTAKDTTGASGSASFTWTISAATGHPITGDHGKCLDDHGSSTANGNKVDIWSCNGTGAQKWTFSGGQLSVLGMCLDDPSQGGNGAPLTIWTCNGHNAQLWTHKSNGEYVLKLNGQCLTDPSGSSVNGTQVQVRACKNYSDQHWNGP